VVSVISKCALARGSGDLGRRRAAKRSLRTLFRLARIACPYRKCHPPRTPLKSATFEKVNLRTCLTKR